MVTVLSFEQKMTFRPSGENTHELNRRSGMLTGRVAGDNEDWVMGSEKICVPLVASQTFIVRLSLLTILDLQEDRGHANPQLCVFTA